MLLKEQLVQVSFFKSDILCHWSSCRM